MNIWLGCNAKDKVTGLEGIIVSQLIHLGDHIQFAIQPPAKDGKVPDAEWFNTDRIELIEGGLKNS